MEMCSSPQVDLAVSREEGKRDKGIQVEKIVKPI